MAIIPDIRELKASSADVLNAIRNSSSRNYRDYVPVAQNDRDSIRGIGGIIMDMPGLQNEFLAGLINRIGKVIVTSEMYRNPWDIFKKGYMEFGETIEDIFVNIVKPFQFDPAVAENKLYAREIPDVRSAFYSLNYQKYYKATTSQYQLRQAFLTENGIIDLVNKIVESMYTSANYDEYQTMKYMLGRAILDGYLNPVEVATVEVDNLKSIISTIKGVSNNMEFMTKNYNLAGVSNYSLKDSQYVIVNTAFDASMDVDVLATAFNLDRAEFMGHRILIDSYSNMDRDRLDELFYGDPNYRSLTDAEVLALDTIPAVIVDRDWFMIYDNLQNFTEKYNEEGLYWNHWLHMWKIFAISPFANSAVFVPGTPAVISVTLSPAEVTVTPGQSIQFSAAVETENFAAKAVNWSIDPTAGAEIDNNGYFQAAADAVAETVYTVTATSVTDSSVTGTATVTIG